MSRKMMITFAFAFLTSVSSFAGTREVTCSSRDVAGYKIIATLDGDSFVQTRDNKGEVVWGFEDYESLSIDPRLILNEEYTDVVKHLMAESKAKEGTYSSVNLIVAAARGATVLEKLEILSDDGAGYALVEYKNSQGKTVAGAMFAGWAGIYTKCKTTKN